MILHHLRKMHSNALFGAPYESCVMYIIRHKKHLKMSPMPGSNTLQKWDENINTLRFSSHFCNGFYIKRQKCGEGRHIQLSLNLYITKWDKIHDSKTCVWTRHKALSMLCNLLILVNKLSLALSNVLYSKMTSQYILFVANKFK